MTVRPHILCLGAVLLMAGEAAAKPAYVPGTLNLRAAPGTTNDIVAKIPGGSLVDVGECTNGWCAVTWQDKSGFAIQTALDVSGRVPRQASRPHVYRPDDGYVAVDEPVYVEEPPPVYYGPRVYYDGPYWGPRWGWRRW